MLNWVQHNIIDIVTLNLFQTKQTGKTRKIKEIR